MVCCVPFFQLQVIVQIWGRRGYKGLWYTEEESDVSCMERAVGRKFLLIRARARQG